MDIHIYYTRSSCNQDNSHYYPGYDGRTVKYSHYPDIHAHGARTSSGSRWNVPVIIVLIVYVLHLLDQCNSAGKLFIGQGGIIRTAGSDVMYECDLQCPMPNTNARANT